MKYPFINLIFSGHKKIENRSRLLVPKDYYALYCPRSSEWKKAASNEVIQSHLDELQLTVDSIDSIRGHIVGVVKLTVATEEQRNSIYNVADLKYKYYVSKTYMVDKEEYIPWPGYQGMKNLRSTDACYQKVQNWCKLLESNKDC